MEYGTHYICRDYSDFAMFVTECQNAGVPVGNGLLEWTSGRNQSWPITPYWSGAALEASRAMSIKKDGPLRLSRSVFLVRLANEFGKMEIARLSSVNGLVQYYSPEYWYEESPGDDKIRVGDTVTSPYCPGYEYLVLQMEPTMSVRITKSPAGNEGVVYADMLPSSFEKIKAATPVSGKQNNKHEVRGSFEGIGIGCGEGKAVRAGRIAGIVAVGGEPAGDPIAARVGKGRIGIAQVLHETVRSGHL